jgi:hypothetical protein
MYRTYLAIGFILVAAFFTEAFLAKEASPLMVKISLEDLTKRTDLILVGKVKRIECEWNGDSTRIFTYVTIAVEIPIKGVSGAEELTIRQLGGTVDSLTLWVSDTPQFKQGEEVLVFLEPVERAHYSVVGWFQGKFTIKDNQVLESNMSLESFVNQIKMTIKMQEEERR